MCRVFWTLCLFLWTNIKIRACILRNVQKQGTYIINIAFITILYCTTYTLACCLTNVLCWWTYTRISLQNKSILTTVTHVACTTTGTIRNCAWQTASRQIVSAVRALTSIINQNKSDFTQLTNIFPRAFVTIWYLTSKMKTRVKIINSYYNQWRIFSNEIYPITIIIRVKLFNINKDPSNKFTQYHTIVLTIICKILSIIS